MGRGIRVGLNPILRGECGLDIAVPWSTVLRFEDGLYWQDAPERAPGPSPCARVHRPEHRWCCEIWRGRPGAAPFSVFLFDRDGARPVPRVGRAATETEARAQAAAFLHARERPS